MDTRNIQRTRSNAWQISVATCSALTSVVSTADPASSVTTAPHPALTIRFGGRSRTPFALMPHAPAPRSAKPAGGSGTAPAPHWAEAAASAPHWAEAAAANPAPAADQTTAAPLPAAEEKKPAHNSHAIELIIDSLPTYELKEPIPVAIDSIGDMVFTAAVRSLDITATGNSIGESLLLLKDQIEHVFEDYNRRLTQLSYDEKTALQMLQTYIAPTAKRRDWA